MTTLASTVLDPTPVGPIVVLATETAVRAVLFGEADAARVHTGGTAVPNDSHPVLVEARRQLEEYFAGDRLDFDLPLDPVGTPFQMQVWQTLRGIPYGSTISYGEQARRLGDPNKARAVGAANGRNPISIVVPCHRVVGSNGSLTGFGGGLGAKAWLLDHERLVVATR